MRRRTPAPSPRPRTSPRWRSLRKEPGADPGPLLDEQLREVKRVNTVGGLALAMMHEFLITDEGNYLFISRNPAVRDLGRYPVPAGKPAPAVAQPTHDAVIQPATRPSSPAR